MDDRPDPISDDDTWVLPLHGLPLPPSADVPAAPPPDLGQGLTPSVFVSDGFAGEPAVTLFPDPDDLPTDKGFHPRLRRSA